MASKIQKHTNISSNIQDRLFIDVPVGSCLSIVRFDDAPLSRQEIKCTSPFNLIAKRKIAQCATHQVFERLQTFIHETCDIFVEKVQLEMRRKLQVPNLPVRLQEPWGHIPGGLISQACLTEATDLLFSDNTLAPIFMVFLRLYMPIEIHNIYIYSKFVIDDFR